MLAGVGLSSEIGYQDDAKTHGAKPETNPEPCCRTSELAWFKHQLMWVCGPRSADTAKGIGMAGAWATIGRNAQAHEAKAETVYDEASQERNCDGGDGVTMIFNQTRSCQ